MLDVYPNIPPFIFVYWLFMLFMLFMFVFLPLVFSTRFMCQYGEGRWFAFLIVTLVVVLLDRLGLGLRSIPGTPQYYY